MLETRTVNSNAALLDHLTVMFGRSIRPQADKLVNISNLKVEAENLPPTIPKMLYMKPALGLAPMEPC